MNVYLLTLVVLVVYWIVAWFVSSIVGIAGRDLWIVRGVLFVLGLIGAAMFLWFHRKVRQPSKATGDGSPAHDLDVLFQHAQTRLTTSQLKRGAKFETLPVVLLLGESGSSKTTLVTQCGIEPELLAGQVYRDDKVISTELANCWFSGGTLFLEAGGRLASDQAVWSRLVRRLKPGKFAAFTRTGGPASRAAIVCVSIEEFQQPEASRLLEGLARKLRTRLEDIAHQLGIRLPVYVLFTKADRIPFFADYVRNLSNAEASKVVGATLELQQEAGTSVWAERETQRLDAAFKDLVFSLCDKRPDYLSREHDSARLPSVYEFPREVGKLRSAMVKFMVDLCKPSQLRITPFLRGFYFTGVRPVVLDERAETPLAIQAEARADFGGATRVFHPGESPLARPQARPSSPGRKVPQWTFVTHFFSDVLLKDRVALGLSGSSVKTNGLRRVLLATASFVLLMIGFGMTVSYVENRSLEGEVIRAARGAEQLQPAGANLPSIEDLTRLESLRQSIETLASYQSDGAPWRLRWGLYSGNNLYPEVRRLYYDSFNRVLFGTTRAQILDTLQRLHDTPGAGDDYGSAYELLKAYLITTSNHENSTRAFLSPILLNRWSEGRNPDPARAALAQKQFDYYSDDLRVANPFSSEVNPQAVEHARKYLAQFAGIERVYQAMLTEAEKKSPRINFGQQVPGSSEVLVVDRELSGAFSKNGWTFMQDAVKNADRFFSGEQWVLGNQASTGVDRQKSEQELSARYTKDFISQWRAFLKGASIVRYANLGDAGKKLGQLSSNQSPLLALFSLASENTAVGSPEVKAAFQAVQFLVPPGNPQQYVGPNNSGYIKALLQLQGAVEQAGNAAAGTSSDQFVTQISNNSSAAKLTTRELALGFGVDADAHLEATIQKLMEDPITNAESLVRNIVPGELNGKGKGLCTQVQGLMTKFPFNPSSAQEATIQELNAAFHPQQGSIWAFYNASLNKYLLKQGPSYIENPAGGVKVSPVFLSFWNRVAAFTDAVYPGESTQPRLSFSLKPYPTRGIDRITLTIEGKTLNASGGKPAAQQFTWTGASNQQVKLMVRVGGGGDLAFPNYDGPWAVFHFFADADTSTASGSTYALEWAFRQGKQGRPVTLPGGSPLTVKFDVDMGGKAPVFQKGYLASLRCVSEIARP